MDEKELLELLIKVAAREQRYACVDSVNTMRNYLDSVRENVQGQIQNTSCPDLVRVLELWHREVIQINGQRHNKAVQPTAVGGG